MTTTHVPRHRPSHLHDCMRACIFPKQTRPIPQIETGALTDCFLRGSRSTRFCARNRSTRAARGAPVQRKNSSCRPRPRRYTLAHYSPRGFVVVASDCLRRAFGRRTQLAVAVSGSRTRPDSDSPSRLLHRLLRPRADPRRAHAWTISPIASWPARRRVEYGITVRWDKNFL